jgi:hypothetical protein
MVIKKYTLAHGNSMERASRLEAYTTQGRSYRATQKNRMGDGNILLKGTLAALIPLAAAGTLNAQCQGPVNGGASIYIGSNSYFQFDVDGDGANDFEIKHRRRLGANSIYGTALSIKLAYGNNNNNRVGPNRLAAGVNVTRAQAGSHLGVLSYRKDGNPINMNFAPGSGSGFLAIRKGDAMTGIPGWIQLEVVNFGKDGANIKILERGYEVDGDNSAITGQCTTLPVEMLYFNTKAKGKEVVLEWATASELNNKGFEVQRSTDGYKFSKIGWVNGNGTSIEQHTYTFTDNAAKPNTDYYYRLKQMDTDGTYEYSDIRTISLVDKTQFSISEPFPNPTDNGTSFQLNMPQDGEVVLSVFDLKGSVLKTQTNAFAQGTSIVHLSTTDLPSGQYYVKLQTGTDVTYRKLMVQ